MRKAGIALADSPPWSGTSMVDELGSALVARGLVTAADADPAFDAHGVKQQAATEPRPW